MRPSEINNLAKAYATAQTESQLQTKLDAWITADAALAKNKSFDLDGVSLTRQDAEVVADRILVFTEAIRLKQAGFSTTESISGIRAYSPRFIRGPQ